LRQGRQEARQALGQLGVRGKGYQLILPQVHITLGQGREVRRVRHGAEYIGAT
jgi:hypothetical protein